MKKIILLFTVLFCGCAENYKNYDYRIADPKSETTIKVLDSMQIMQVAIFDNEVYILKDSLVYRKAFLTDGDIKPIRTAASLFFILWFFLLGLLAMWVIT